MDLARRIFNLIIEHFISNSNWFDFKLFKSKHADYMLIKYAWPLIGQDSIIHDSYHCEKFLTMLNYMRPFPIKRDSFCYMSTSLCCSNEDLMAPLPECPSRCRLKKDWFYC
jgi:hypothetical protein